MSGCHIAGIGTATAEQLPAEAIGASSVDAAELLATVGFEARHAPERDISPFQLGVGASRAALQAAGVTPAEVELILHVGRVRIEYFTWGLSLAIAKELGHLTPRCLDVSEFTGPSLVAGLRLLGSKFHADERLGTALLVFPHRFSDLVDTGAPEDRWLWPLSDGAGALVVRRGHGPGTPLGSAFASDGTAGRGIGLRTEVVDDGPDPDGFFGHQWALAKYYFLRDPEGWRVKFQARVAERLADTVERATARAGLTLDDLTVVQTGYLYPTMAEQLRQRLGVGPRLRTQNAQGMMGGAEMAFALQGLMADPALRGTPVTLAGFGLPAHFGALTAQL
jgi:3-oxoacyl-[acyl-carrier-protein] synthase III